MTSRDRQRTPAELQAQGESLLRRLARSLDDWDRGDPDAIADVAAYARTLLSFGKGDKLIQRLASAHRVELPMVRVYRQPDVGPAVRVSIGGMPVDPWLDVKDAEEVAFNDWLRRTVALLPNANRRKTTWAQFVTDYGNMLGAHASGTVPEVLESVTLAKGPNGHLAGYVLRAAAVVAEGTLWAVLDSLGCAEPQQVRSAHPDGLLLTGIAVGDGPGAWHAFGMSATDSRDRELLRMPFEGQTLRVTWIWDAESATGALRTEIEPATPATSDLATY
jgi:hypothetical protein